MINAKEKLGELLATPAQVVPLHSLGTDDALQPRVVDLVPSLKVRSVKLRTDTHVATMRAVLEASGAVDLDPILVAQVKGERLIVDGHHRARAYRLAKRERIPARVAPMSKEAAVLVSKLVNCGSRSLEMETGQRADAAWQTLAAVTRRGADGLPKGMTLRSVAADFGLGRGTIHRMVKKLPHVFPEEFVGDDLDPGTGWPRWRAVMRREPDDPEGSPLNHQARAVRRTVEWLGTHVKQVQERSAKVGPEVMQEALKEACEQFKVLATNPEHLELLQMAAEAARDDPGELLGECF